MPGLSDNIQVSQTTSPTPLVIAYQQIRQKVSTFDAQPGLVIADRHFNLLTKVSLGMYGLTQ